MTTPIAEKPATKPVKPTETKPADIPADQGKIETTENPMVSKESALALRSVAIEEHGKREDKMNEFLADLPKSVAADVRKETKAFISDLRSAAGKVTSAIVHLWNVRKAFADVEDLDVEQTFTDYGKALVSEGYVTAGTFYTLSKKIEVFETLKLPEPARAAIMAYSGGDSVIVREPLTKEEIAAFKKANPAGKVPKGKYVASKYFVRACEVVESPAKWTPESSDSFAGAAVRLAAKLRGKDRSGKGTDGVRGDDAKVNRFETATDKLEVFISGQSTDSGVKGMIVLADKTREHEMLTECGETILTALCNRLPLDVLNTFYENIDTIFTERIQKLQKKADKAAA